MINPAQGTSVPSTVHFQHDSKFSVLFFRNQPVITLLMMDKMYDLPPSTSSQYFKQHGIKLIEDRDYFDLHGLILITESGYDQLMVSFKDDLAWQLL